MKNAKAAVELSGAKALDVSSGVGTAPGVKDPALIKALLGIAQWGPSPSPEKVPVPAGVADPVCAIVPGRGATILQ